MNFEQFAQSITPTATVTDVAATTPMWATEKETAALAAHATEVAEREAKLAAYDPHTDPSNPFRHLLTAPGTAPAQTPAPTARAEAAPTETTPVQLRRIAEELRRQASDLEAAAARIETQN